ncbi:DNA repair protein RecN [Lachnoanaerobaculum umeaense]|uniref:DNA repair protein RecN n=1 Tax=Lachnoanaerobaculum umeaense TaxID=617123 RepID=A0A385Q162_9FIRM|nr:DNA repair protein RecN [Lachnoanaerobaculum umeaense]AYA99916.1 DNA repair protein RecN [Lachnoanaerobaculum umeaense]PZW98309.1 DNA repair protein RecN (Recombination protein N) [Lachnoanaerobaculum umeaense]
MLIELHIKNLALIKKADIYFKEGLSVLSGETGAGKSILIDSINLALGAKANKDIIRIGENEGFVELIFTLDEKRKEKLKELDISFEDNLLILTRKISSTRSVCRINDETVTLAKLRQITDTLIDIHGQHEHQSLLSAGNNLSLLDSFCPNEIMELKNNLSKDYGELKRINQRIQEGIDERLRKREIDILDFEISEIKNADIKMNEEEELEQIFKKGKNISKINDVLSELLEELENESIGSNIREISDIATLDDELDFVVSNLNTIEDLISETIHYTNKYLDGLEYNEKEYNRVIERLDIIRHIKSKYSNDYNKIKELLKEKEKRLEFLKDYEGEVVILKESASKLQESILMKCSKISDMRKNIAITLTERIKEELEDLNFLGVEFEIKFTKKDKISRDGYDAVEFLISTNPGQPLKPLQMVASGGELSRIMLALKTVFANNDDIQTLIFDEIDTGISGKTAVKVGEKLRNISKGHQVLCISHLPQIAVMADQNLFISKSTDGKSTQTNIDLLDKNGKIKEIARLIGGSNLTEGVLKTAREMIQEADSRR